MALPSLSSQQLRKIEGLIQGWTTRLTWDLLVQRIETDLDINITRQTLDTYLSISIAFKNRKQALRGKPTEALKKFTKGDLDMASQIEKLNAENTVLNKKVERQMAFISEIAAIAQINPSVMAIMEDLKHKVKRNG